MRIDKISFILIFIKNGIKNLKEIIIKTVTHYLNGNKLAFMEFFVAK